MKVKQINVENFQGVRNAAVVLDKPVTLFAGLNAAGKSSLSEAVRLALAGETVRVSLKKEYAALVTEGCKSGHIEVAVSGLPNGADCTCFVTLPGGKSTPLTEYVMPPALPYVLDAQRFAHLDAKERRSFLFGLMGLKLDVPAIVERLKRRGLDEKRIQTIAPLLRGGFESACTDVKAKATEAKGAWRQVTGETYGSKKGESWKAEAPLFDPNALAKMQQAVADADQAIEAADQKLGAMREIEKQRQARLQRLGELREQVKGLERAQRKLSTDEESLKQAAEALDQAKAAAGDGPRVGLVHDLARVVQDVVNICQDSEGVSGYHTNGDVARWDEFELPAVAATALAAYEREHGSLNAPAGDPQANARVATLQTAHDTCARAVANDRRDIATIEAAATELKRLEAEVDAELTDIPAAEAALAQLRTQRLAAFMDLEKVQAAKRAADAADKKTADAAGHHAAVVAWDAIADALSPDGIPAEILTEALGPINARLEQSAADSEWPRVEIGKDMTLTSGGRAYALLSESEQWRADAMLAEAVSNVSGLKLLVLDRMDVLDTKGRSDLLAWLDVLATEGELETALVFATLKALPAGLPSTVASEWIDAGCVGQQLKAAA